jgi:hypothetical protein
VLAQRLTQEPGDHPHDRHGRCCEKLLEVRARQPNGASPAQIKTPRAWRGATLHSGPQGILGFERGGLLPLASGLQRLMVRLQSDDELPWGVFR